MTRHVRLSARPRLVCEFPASDRVPEPTRPSKIMKCRLSVHGTIRSRERWASIMWIFHLTEMQRIDERELARSLSLSLSLCLSFSLLPSPRSPSPPPPTNIARRKLYQILTLVARTNLGAGNTRVLPWTTVLYYPGQPERIRSVTGLVNRFDFQALLLRRSWYYIHWQLKRAMRSPNFREVNDPSEKARTLWGKSSFCD